MKVLSLVRGVVGVLPLLAGCATVVPMQPASTVPVGTWQAGGQLALSPWCGLSGDLVGRCADLPQGLPLPELRLQGRTGVAEGTDVGLSLFASTHLPPGSGYGAAVRWGAYVDGKRELRTWELGEGRRRIISVAPGVGLALAPVAPRNFLAPDVDVGLPVLFGHQTQGWEWVAGAQVLGRLQVRPDAADPEARLRGRAEVGLLVGAFSRGPTRTAYQLGYTAPVDRPGGGRLTLGFSLAFDVKR